ncbi:hypothetical protein TVAG_475250 [Trichomonas vaginalis G3]|uniref:receptor protein-tyrosine kinase n=1 Tax=Trichomonas vaginalis (strain ATCC PRA-98 / G3) TaxID=412133 RepID=A2EM32_TRIV3|nr:glycine-rich protein family [Trichomonas vaginalis G3]EAY06291.1 hypothetical protein TVAG_475250 [Trichomonas vaginalis G3]KAI5503369.1 glycine-rich protein family [Trichomonas vaginalis G3]|eukprot:XP_001318514.1 hypothetical protein [Trichomonas vaginalis G3]
MNGIFGFGANKTHDQQTSGGGGGGLFGGGAGYEGGCSGGGGSGVVYSSSKPPQIRDIKEIKFENGNMLDGVNIGDGYAVISRFYLLYERTSLCDGSSAFCYFLFTRSMLLTNE